MIRVENGKITLEGSGFVLVSESAKILYDMTITGDEDEHDNVGDVVFATIVAASLKLLYTENKPLADRCMNALTDGLLGLVKEFDDNESEVKPS